MDNDRICKLAAAVNGLAELGGVRQDQGLPGGGGTFKKGRSGIRPAIRSKIRRGDVEPGCRGKVSGDKAVSMAVAGLGR